MFFGTNSRHRCSTASISIAWERELCAWTPVAAVLLASAPFLTNESSCSALVTLTSVAFSANTPRPPSAASSRRLSAQPGARLALTGPPKRSNTLSRYTSRNWQRTWGSIQLDIENSIEYSIEISIEFYRVSHSTAKLNRKVNRIFNRVFNIQLN